MLLNGWKMTKDEEKLSDIPDKAIIWHNLI